MKISLSMLFGLLLFSSGIQPEQTESRVETASQEQSTTANIEVQQREREEYVKSIRVKLDEYDKKFDDLEAKLSKTTGTAKDDFRNLIQQLREQKKGIATQLDSAKNLSPDAWRRMKAEVDSTVAKLERSCQDVSRKIELTPVTPSKKDQQKSY
jgi:hypothetical protein